MIIKFNKQFEVNFDKMEVYNCENEFISTLNCVDTDRWSFEDINGKKLFLTKQAYWVEEEWINSYCITEVIERTIMSTTCKQ